MIDNNNYCNNNDWLSVQYPPLFASASVNDYCSIYPFIWKGLFIMGTRGQAIQSELLNYEILLRFCRPNAAANFNERTIFQISV